MNFVFQYWKQVYIIFFSIISKAGFNAGLGLITKDGPEIYHYNFDPSRKVKKKKKKKKERKTYGYFCLMKLMKILKKVIRTLPFHEEVIIFQLCHPSIITNFI